MLYLKVLTFPYGLYSISTAVNIYFNNDFGIFHIKLDGISVFCINEAFLGVSVFLSLRLRFLKHEHSI